MTRTQAVRGLLQLALFAGLGGCAGFPHFAHWAPIRPVAPVGEHQFAREDGYYSSAKAAIGRRDYGQALELLQAARASKPDDVRVLNAFGVVYDKLGRFDLSDRYYAQAKALDPTSVIVANNLAYSAALQIKGPTPSLAETPSRFAQGSPAAQPVQLALSRPAVVRLGFASAASAPVVTLALAGRPLLIADASGHTGAAEPLRQQLVRLGWSASRVEARSVQAVANSSISYPARSVNIAKALARTLPAGVQLVDCGSSCEAVQLIVGVDAAKWPVRPHAVVTQRGE